MAGQFSPVDARADATSSPSATNRTCVTSIPIGKPAAGGKFSFPPQARILRTAQYRKIYDQGTRIPGPLFAAFCLARTGEDAAEGPRIGITVPRAIGKANVRNRIKRRLREAFRLHRQELSPQWDVVLNPRTAAYQAEFSEIEQALGKVISRCNSRS